MPKVESGLVAPAAFRAVAHLVPAASPFLAPGEGQPAGHAGFDGQFAFFHARSSGRFGRRLGRASNSPLQFGQRPPRGPSTQGAQKVHSNEQIRARGDSGGRSQSQRSQWGRMSSTGVLQSNRQGIWRTMPDPCGRSSLVHASVRRRPCLSHSPLRGRRNAGNCARHFWPRTAHHRRKPSGYPRW